MAEESVGDVKEPVEEIRTEIESEREQVVEDPNEKKGELSRRDALEVAMELHNLKEKGEKPKEEVAAPAKVESKQTPQAEEPKKLKAPAQWTKEEQADFEALTPKQQEAHMRLYNSAMNKFSELRQKGDEVKWATDLAKELTPFLKSRGDKNPVQSISAALKFTNQFGGPDATEADKRACVAAYLRANGMEVPKDFVAEGDTTKVDEKISPLQKDVNDIKQELSQRKASESAAVMHQVWTTFEATKNAAGTARYPDINETETGLKLSSYIGNLVRGDTELSKQFIASVTARIPNLTPHQLLEEAYKFGGGRIDDTQSTARAQDPQKHLQQSKRAASSVPGRGVSQNGSPPRKMSRRDAIAQAVADYRETNGN